MSSNKVSKSFAESGLEFAFASNDVDGGSAVARALGGSLYADQRDEWLHLPFRALGCVVTDDLAQLRDVADVGLYVVCRRTVKAGPANVFALFPLVHHPEQTHEQSDAHWRDVHAPLALVHHGFMTHYTQLSVVHHIGGLAIDGFALCGFDSITDLRERFYTAPSSRDVILADIQSFADTKKSPRRLIATRSVGPREP